MNPSPWERRFLDLTHHLDACTKTYFEPDLFRINVNNFLQTARTVTFIIQKNKSEIHDFDNWYQQTIDSWKADELMTWAKDSRNQIEKIGDLELNSLIEVKVFSSYMEEYDLKLNCIKKDTIGLGIKRLVRFAQKNLPTGSLKESSLQINRKWIAATLTSHELLSALSYIHQKHFQCLKSLAKHLGTDLPSSIQERTSAHNVIQLQHQSEYIKLKDMKSYRLGISEKNNEIPEKMKAEIHKSFEKINHKLNEISCIDSVMNNHEAIAELIFSKYQSHKHMLFLYDRDWKMIEIIGHAPEDQVDKYFFWRLIGEQIKVRDVFAIVYIGEVWLRENRLRHPYMISELPILGEQLQLSSIDRDGNKRFTTWDIKQEKGGETKKLFNRSIINDPKYQPNMFIPVMKGMDLELNIPT